MTTLLTAILYLWLALTILLIIMWFLREQDRRHKDQHQNDLEDELLNGSAGPEPEAADSTKTEEVPAEDESATDSVIDDEKQGLMSSRCLGPRTPRNGRKRATSETVLRQNPRQNQTTRNHRSKSQRPKNPKSKNPSLKNPKNRSMPKNPSLPNLKLRNRPLKSQRPNKPQHRLWQKRQASLTCSTG